MGTLDIVVGGQFGSEAKGHVTKQVLNMRMRTIDAPSHYYVNYRVAGPNAGHCVRDESDNKYALRTIPVGAVFPYVELVIAPGSEIAEEVLFSEIAGLELGGHVIAGRLHISAEATILTREHKIAETGMQERMGSTGKGIGAARADRLMRTAKRVGDDETLVKMIEDVGGRVYHGMHPFDDIHDRCVVIEGTQGYGLGLHAGFYPQCTSSDTRAIDFAAMAGLNPWDFSEFVPWIVARVYPIRVAGNSGPLKGESSWEDLGLPQEFTTVTKKVRRVGEWDADLVEAAIRANGRNSRVAITMLDQKFGSVQGLDNHLDPTVDVGFEDEVIDFLADLPGVTPDRVHLVTTGEDTAVWLAPCCLRYTCRAGMPCHSTRPQRGTDHNDPEPQPGDGPDYHADHAAWAARQPQPLTPKEVLARDLNQWWMDTAHDEATAVVDKAVEYGANSMTELGHEIAKLAGRQITDRQAIELACYFYIKGKMGRWSDSIIAGRPVSDDTLGDIGVYVRMAQRVRSHGGWPGTPNDGKEQGA